MLYKKSMKYIVKIMKYKNVNYQKIMNNLHFENYNKKFYNIIVCYIDFKCKTIKYSKD